MVLSPYAQVQGRIASIDLAETTPGDIGTAAAGSVRVAGNAGTAAPSLLVTTDANTERVIYPTVRGSATAAADFLSSFGGNFGSISGGYRWSINGPTCNLEWSVAYGAKGAATGDVIMNFASAPTTSVPDVNAGIAYTTHAVSGGVPGIHTNLLSNTGGVLTLVPRVIANTNGASTAILEAAQMPASGYTTGCISYPVDPALWG